MAIAKLLVKDEVNVRFKGVDQDTLEACQDVLTYYVPGFVHMPSYKLGRWDGKIRLFQKSGYTYLNLVEHVIPILDDAGYTIDIEEENPWVNDISPQMEYIDNSFLSDYGITLWDHQVEAVNSAIRYGQGILELATGAGKTLICGSMAKIWQQFGRVVVICPSIDLVVQTQGAFNKIGLESGIWFGDRKERQATTVATWQSLDHFPELFAGVKCVIVDEVHQAAARTISEMLSGPGATVPFRFGCTGTLPKEDLYRMQILGTIGPPIYSLATKSLQDKGILADATIYQIALADSKNQGYVNVCDGHEEWKDELDWMFSEEERVEYMVETIKEVSEMGNTLVLVQYRKHGKILEGLIPGSLSLDGRNRNRREHYDAFNEGDNNTLICTFGIASTGIDIPRIFNLVIIEPGKKFQKVIQTLGRGLRRADDKSHLNVFDICGDAGLSKSHASKRRTLYREAQQKIKVIPVEYKL